MTDITYGAKAEQRTAVALGYFDGLHLGHVGVIQAAMSQTGLMPAVFTFNTDTTLPKFEKREDIISFENKCELMAKMGVRYIYAPDFAEVCGYSDEKFVSEILVKRLNAGYVCCGSNFRFGKSCSTPQRLAEICAGFGVRTEVVADICLDGEMISSTRIRELIRNGEIEGANRLLGYELWYRLPVVKGNMIGRTLNFPTINQIIPETNIIPRFGVYVSFVNIGGVNMRGITNIGVKPTVENRRDGTGAVMETHIIDYSGDLYGQRIAVSLCRFIRPEKRFASLDELKAQIEADKKTALECEI